MTGDKKPASALGKAFPIDSREENGAATWLDAYLPAGRKWKRRIFKTEEIHRIESIDPKIAQLCLQDGTSIPVLMDPAALWQKVFAPDFRAGGEPISLLSVTGADAFPAPILPEFGELVEGEGVYIGRYEPRDAQGMSIGKVFNVYAAPEDLTVDISYNSACEKLRNLQNWHGYDGIDYASSSKMMIGLINGSYRGQWIMPPMEVVESGPCEASFFRQKNAGALLGTFNSVKYMTSSLATDQKSFQAFKIDSGEKTDIDPTFTDNRACRPVRLVELKPGY